MLDVIEPFIATCDNQLGFKKKHSTEHCIYALKMLFPITIGSGVKFIHVS